MRPGGPGLAGRAGDKPWGLSAAGGLVFQSPFASFPGKKARTFDLEAMFEQTRRTAVERSRKVLGKKCECSWLLYFKTFYFKFLFAPSGRCLKCDRLDV